MVRNTELKETSAATKLIAETVASMIKQGRMVAGQNRTNHRQEPVLCFSTNQRSSLLDYG